MNNMIQQTAGKGTGVGPASEPCPAYPVSLSGNVVLTEAQPAGKAGSGGKLERVLAVQTNPPTYVGTTRRRTMSSEKTTTTGGNAGEVTNNTGNGHKVDAFLIPFNQIEVSKWNRSRNITLDAAYIEELAEDIKRNGLLHPVTLVKTADGTGYRIVAGANRVAALRKLRGENSGLKQTEFKVREDMDESNEKCLAVSLSENHHRRASSVYEMAVYVDRLIKEQKVDQGKLARMLNLDRPKVNRLEKLVDCYGALPESWQRDLGTSPTAVAANGILITFTHWYEVAGQIKSEITTEVGKVLEKAYAERWSTRQLRDEIRRAIKGLPESGSDGDAGGAGTPPKRVSRTNPIEILKAASQNLRNGSALVKAEHAEDAATLVQYADTVDGIVQKLETAKVAEKDAKQKAREAAKAQKDAERAAKKAKRDAEKAQRKAAADAKKATAAAKRAKKAEAKKGQKGQRKVA
jgi:ParB/RepB/Spo0J family partition protein